MAALAAVGIEAEIVCWGGTLAPRFDAAIVRGCWDYIDARESFLSWCAALSERMPLASPVDVLRWNTDKRYLRDLAAAGVPVVPTSWGLGDDGGGDERGGGQGGGLPEGEFVVKPAVSAGARNSARYAGRPDWVAARAHVAAIEAGGGVAMIQPFVPSVESVGETGTYVFGGVVSHAIRKMGILDAGAPPAAEPTASSVDRVGPVPVDPQLAAFALDVLAVSPGPCLYARVDTVPGPDGTPLLMELEVTEPYLFLKDQPAAADAFAAAAASWLGRGRRSGGPR